MEWGQKDSKLKEGEQLITHAVRIDLCYILDVADKTFCIYTFFFQGGDLRYCQKCGHYKPPRAHHCRACKRCVLKMVLISTNLSCIFC